MPDQVAENLQSGLVVSDRFGWGVVGGLVRLAIAQQESREPGYLCRWPGFGLLQLPRMGSDGDLLAGLGNAGNPVEALAQGLLQRLHFLQFAMHQIQLGVMVEMTDPVEQL